MQPSIASLFPKAAGPAPAPAPAPPAPAPTAVHGGQRLVPPDWIVPAPGDGPAYRNPVAAPAPAKKQPAPRPSKPSKHLLGARLQPVGAAQLEKKIEALRTKQPEARIVVLSLCWRLRCGSADAYRVMNEPKGAAYDTFKTQTVLSYYEFMGLCGEGGVGDAIVEALSEDERTHVLVVDATPKAELARLAACFGAVRLKLAKGRVIKVAPPANPLFAEAVAAASVCTAASMLHYTMEAHFDAHMAYETEPVGDDDSGEGVAKKAKKPRKT